MGEGIEIGIEHGDITSFVADVIALKHAMGFFGADLDVARALSRPGQAIEEQMPAPGRYVLLESRGAVRAPRVLFVGTAPLQRLRYPQIRELARRALEIVCNEVPAAEHLAMTVHGVRYGLDEVEAALAQLSGYADYLARGRLAALRRISIVEHSAGRVERLRQGLERDLPRLGFVPRGAGHWVYTPAGGPVEIGPPPVAEPQARAVAPTGKPQVGTPTPAVEKPHAFIAMPYDPELDDVYYYGIQRPVHASGLLCERVDQEVFTGDILARIRERIKSAAVVIAEMTGGNPNVYLELGYAWGVGRPTVLLAKGVEHLRFDVQGQRCLVYGKIKELEDRLGTELEALKAKGIF